MIRRVSTGGCTHVAQASPHDSCHVGVRDLYADSSSAHVGLQDIMFQSTAPRRSGGDKGSTTGSCLPPCFFIPHLSSFTDKHRLWVFPLSLLPRQLSLPLLSVLLLFRRVLLHLGRAPLLFVRVPRLLQPDRVSRLLLLPRKTGTQLIVHLGALHS